MPIGIGEDDRTAAREFSDEFNAAGIEANAWACAAELDGIAGVDLGLNYQVQWTGNLRIPRDGLYTFHLAAKVRVSVRPERASRS